MDIERRSLITAVCAVLCGMAMADILSYSTPQNQLQQSPQTEVSPVQLEITIPLAAEQLAQLADTASPAVWRDLLRRTPDAARRALLAQLRSRRRRSETPDRSRHRAPDSQDRPQERARGGGLASRLSSYSGLATDSSTRRAYTTLERDAGGRRRVSPARSPPSARHAGQTDRPAAGQTGLPRPRSESPRERSEPSSSYHPPSTDAHRPTSSQRPPLAVLTEQSSSEAADLSSSYSSWDASLASSGLSPPHRRPNSVLSGSGPFPRSQTSALHGHSPPVTTYRPGREQVTTYRPSRSEVTTHRRGRAEMSTYRPSARSDAGPPSAQYGPPRRPIDSGRPLRGQHRHPAAGHGSGQEHERHHGHEGVEWLMDVVPGIPGEDYPILASIPSTSFSCAGRPQGYYSDVATRCQVYHVCHGTFQMSSFLCPNGTVFSQPLSTCDWWFNTDCSSDLPLPGSTFRVSRQTSRFMFEDDWLDDYEDFHASETNRPKQARSRHRANYRKPKSAHHTRRQESLTARRHRRPGDHSAPGGRNHSISSGRDQSAPGGSDRSVHSGSAGGDWRTHNGSGSSDRSAHSGSGGGGRGVTWRSPFANAPSSGTTETYRRPGRHLTAATTPSGKRRENYPTKERKQRQTRRTKTFVATLRTPASEDGERKSVTFEPFVVRVSYGGKSGRTSKELKFGPEAARSFLSRAQMRRWSFTGGSAIERRIGVTETAADSEEHAGNTAHEARPLEEARDGSFDFEIGRRPSEAQVGSESRVRPRSVLPPDVTGFRQPSPGTSRQSIHRPVPTRPMARPADLTEVAPPETSVEPPTVAESGTVANRAGNRGVTASQRDSETPGRYVFPERSTVPSLTQEESQREEAPIFRRGGLNAKLSFAELTTDDPGSAYGGNELVADDPLDFDYNTLLKSDLFKNYGLKLSSAQSPYKNRQNPG